MKGGKDMVQKNLFVLKQMLTNYANILKMFSFYKVFSKAENFFWRLTKITKNFKEILQ